ncbi:AMP-binding protein [Thermodesulfobacteriota bacterium]
MLIGDIARINARRFKDKIAFKDEKTEVSFEKVNDRSNSLVRALMDVGLQKGDRIAVLLYNCMEYNEILFALPKGGFITVPLNYRLVGRELTYIIENSEACTLIYGDEFSDTVEEIRDQLSCVSNYIIVGNGNESKAEALHYDKMIKDHPPSGFSVQAKESDIAFIIYTSGTTGFPKGAMLTHKNIITNLFNAVFERSPKQDDRLFNVPPLYHCAAQTETMSYFFCGGLTITRKQFDPQIVLETIRAEKPNVLLLVPAMQNMVINHPSIGDYDLNCVELMLYGGSSMMRSQLEKSMEIFGCKFLQTAGLTEAGPILTMLAPEDHVIDGPEYIVQRLSSAGKEAKLTEVKIVDSKGNELPPNTPGEEIARGDNVMKGYWNRPEETANTIINGWLHTGDICMKDEYGYIYYLDRIKDMICRGGEKMSTLEKLKK